MTNYNEAIYRQIQQTLTELAQRLQQVNRDIEATELNLAAMVKERETVNDAITRNQGGLSLCFVINNSNYVIAENTGEKVELGQPQVSLQTSPPAPSAAQASAPQAPTAAPQQSQPSTTQQQVVPQQITPQAQQQFAPPQQFQGQVQPQQTQQRAGPPYNPVATE